MQQQQVVYPAGAVQMVPQQQMMVPQQQMMVPQQQMMVPQQQMMVPQQQQMMVPQQQQMMVPQQQMMVPGQTNQQQVTGDLPATNHFLFKKEMGWNECCHSPFVVQKKYWVRPQEARDTESIDKEDLQDRFENQSHGYNMTLKSDWYFRWCFPLCFPFWGSIKDPVMGKTNLSFHRPCQSTCMARILPCCNNPELFAYNAEGFKNGAPRGDLQAYAQGSCHLCAIKIKTFGPDKEKPRFTISYDMCSPCCGTQSEGAYSNCCSPSLCCKHFNFDVLNAEEDKVMGKITYGFSGCCTCVQPCCLCCSCVVPAPNVSLYMNPKVAQDKTNRDSLLAGFFFA